jgi:hypothetical protein
VLELAAGLVARFLVPMVTITLGQWADHHREPGRAGPVQIRWAAGQASMPNGLSIRAGYGDAEPTPRVGRRRGTQLTGQHRVHRPKSGHVTRFVRQPKLGEQRDRQRDPRGQPA